MGSTKLKRIMVKTEDVPDNWREVFERKRLVPPHSQTVRLAADRRSTRSSGFQLSPNRVTAPHLSQPQDAAEEQDVLYQLRVTLFDRNHHQFFGKTWKSQSERMKNGRISFSERLPHPVPILSTVPA
ncbi:unnamed protein product [Tetraodon nigroviridis]|uniref:(spotted green pufferfish) hypothetical protein n=1 Tax=Tetraodon nigroviridis TaxID=99883 RepID=Q4SC74_TETNG|nr:unnamed protein product [Tetraodon nigroviridis]